MFGSFYFGQLSFGESPVIPPIHGKCGGQIFGGFYFGQRTSCADIPPVQIPPVEPPVEFAGGANQAHLHGRSETPKRIRVPIDLDDDDELLVLAWLEIASKS